MQPKQVSHAAKFLYLSHLTIFTRLDDHNTSANGGAEVRAPVVRPFTHTTVLFNQAQRIAKSDMVLLCKGV